MLRHLPTVLRGILAATMQGPNTLVIAPSLLPPALAKLLLPSGAAARP